MLTIALRKIRSDAGDELKTNAVGDSPTRPERVEMTSSVASGGLNNVTEKLTGSTIVTERYRSLLANIPKEILAVSTLIRLRTSCNPPKWL
jgi:hypothetical protein